MNVNAKRDSSRIREIEIMDCTLRDGEQTNGVSFLPHEKLMIARMLLHDINVDRIEVASARVSEGEKDAVARICRYAKTIGKLDSVEVLGFVDNNKSVDWIADREVHTTTVADTLSQTNKLHGNTNGDRLGIVHLIEVNVQQRVGHGVELKFLEDSCVVLAVNIEVDHIDVGSVDELAEVAHRHCESLGNGLAILTFLLAIEVAGDKSLLTQFFRSFLSKVCTLLTCNINLFHVVLL